MGATFQSYGSTYTGTTNFTASGTILAALPQSRYEIDHIRVTIVSLDSGGTVAIGFGASANSPQIFYSETSGVFDQHFDQPGIGNPGVANDPLNIAITGTNANVNVK